MAGIQQTAPPQQRRSKADTAHPHQPGARPEPPHPDPGGIINLSKMTQTESPAPSAELCQSTHTVVFTLSCTVSLKLSLRRALHDELACTEEGVLHAHVVRHTHVVQMLDTDTGWLTMELVNSCSLARMLDHKGSLQ